MYDPNIGEIEWNTISPKNGNKALQNEARNRGKARERLEKVTLNPGKLFRSNM